MIEIDEYPGHLLLFPGLRDMPTNSGIILQVPGQLASMIQAIIVNHQCHPYKIIINLLKMKRVCMDPVMAGYNIARLVSQPPLNNIAIDDVAHNAFNFNLKEKMHLTLKEQ